MDFDVIVVGAGAAGLMAMRELVRAGRKVCLLEATDSAGGRIATITQYGLDGPAETGAEFIHGEPPLTLKLLKEAGIPYRQTTGTMDTVRNGVWFDDNGGDMDMDKFMQQAMQLTTDKTIQDFLDKNFPEGEYDSLRNSILGFSQGFTLADPGRGSVMALREELQNSAAPQYRPQSGYGQLVNYLLTGCQAPGSIMHFSSPVSRVEHTTGKVTVYTTQNGIYDAARLIVTASAGVMQSGSIVFSPDLTGHAEAWKQIGFGSVVKILFWFSRPFWKQQSADTGFVLSDAPVPVWWTQLPAQSNLLTGWLGGRNAVVANQQPGDELYEQGLSSLSSIFGVGIASLRQLLVHHKITCWDQQPFVKGGYSYTTPGSHAAKDMLRKPVNNTIYFAGEALYKGHFRGTVEAALDSGLSTANQIINP